MGLIANRERRLSHPPSVTICHQLYAYADFALTWVVFRFTTDEN